MSIWPIITKIDGGDCATLCLATLDRWRAWERPWRLWLTVRWQTQLARRLGEDWFGITAKRRLPRLQRGQRLRSYGGGEFDAIFIRDAFTRNFEPGIEAAAMRVLERLGMRIAILPALGAGRTLLSKGMLHEVQQHARRLVGEVRRIDPQGVLPVFGIEPSEIYTLCDEYPDLIAGDLYTQQLSKRAWSIEEFLLRYGIDKMRIANIHPINYQRTQHNHKQQTHHPARALLPKSTPSSRRWPAGRGGSKCSLAA